MVCFTFILFLRSVARLQFERSRICILCAMDKEKTYDLPDGNSITVGAICLRCVGMSFQSFSTGNGASGSATLLSSVMKCDADALSVARPCFDGF